MPDTGLYNCNQMNQMIMFAEATRETLTGIVRSTSNFSVILPECAIQVYSRFENTRP